MTERTYIQDRKDETDTRALNDLAHSPHMNRSQNQMLVPEKK
jgi:hypothetical protein